MSVANMRRGGPSTSGGTRFARGQIATFLLLVVVAALIFVMMTANLGKLAVQATTVANAADAASLLLGSQLATKSGQIYRAMGNRDSVVVRGGWLSTALSIVFAIVGFFLLPGIGAVLGAVAGGALGGAVGSAVQGTDPGVGALQGAIVGVSMVGGAISIGIVGVGLAAGAAMYNKTVEEGVRIDTIDTAMRALSRLPEDRQVQERVIYEALSRSVDDPVMVPDTGDVNGDGTVDNEKLADLDADGRTDDTVQRWTAMWTHRLLGFDAAGQYEEMAARITAFAEGPLKRFRDVAEAAYRTCEAGRIRGTEAELLAEAQAALGRSGWSQWQACAVAGWLTRRDLEGSVQGSGPGALEQLARPLETVPRTDSENQTRYALDFWHEGPTMADFNAWANSEDENATLTESNGGGDAADEAIEALVSFVETVDPIQAKVQEGKTAPQVLESLAVTWKSWTRLFFDPEVDASGATPSDLMTYYGWLGRVLDGMSQWEARFRQIRGQLPACEFDADHPVPGGPPPVSIDFYAAYFSDPGNIGVPNDYGLANESGTLRRLCQLAGYPLEGSGSISVWSSCGDNGLVYWRGGSFWDTANGCNWGGGYLTSVTCQMGAPTNFPCRWNTTATVDQDLQDQDEFEAVLAAGGPLKTFISEVETFRAALKQFHTTMQGIENRMFADNVTFPDAFFIPASNGLAYQWRDSRGWHKVDVRVKFRLPWVSKKKKSTFFGAVTKTTYRLENGSDNGSFTWVKVTRSDPATGTGVDPTIGQPAQPSGLWPWNPFHGRTTKCSKTKYSWSAVGLAGVSGCS